jgi:hypothetical protein
MRHPTRCIAFTYVHLCAARCIASWSAEWKCIHRLLPLFEAVDEDMIASKSVTRRNALLGCSVRDTDSESFLIPMDGRVQDGETPIAPQPPAQTQDRPQRRRSSIPSFLIVSFILFMLTSHNGDEFLARHQYQNALHTLTVQSDDYATWLNGTASNFTMVRSYVIRFAAILVHSYHSLKGITWWTPCSRLSPSSHLLRTHSQGHITRTSPGLLTVTPDSTTSHLPTSRRMIPENHGVI